MFLLFRRFSPHLLLSKMMDSSDNFTTKPKYRAIALVATPILIAGGVYIAWNYAGRLWKKQEKPTEPRPMFARCVSLATLHGGSLALERLLEYHGNRANEEELETALSQFKSLFKQEKPNFKELQRLLVKLEMTGKEDEAVALLENELAKSRGRNESHEAYEIEMLLVEMLIYKGDFKKASECECLKESKISDARRPLYNAIIQMLLKKDAEAKVYWEEFKEARTHLLTPQITEEHEHFYKLVTDFAEFTNVVKGLDNEIQKARENQ
ncbi:hypothetical protein SLE2022_387330 [Rubroshorea leprosula]